MGVFDKIKNALFEVEYVEVEEPPKKEKKKEKIKEKTIKREAEKLEPEEDKDEVKPIAKRVVLPGKREEKIQELQEEDLKDDNFEARPKDEEIKISRRDKFNFDDEDLVEEVHRPEIVKVIEKEESIPVNDEYDRPLRREREEIREEVIDEVIPVHKEVSRKKEIIDTNKYYNKPQPVNKPYGMDKGINVSMHEYGTYERKEEKSGFKPSPIISPIYGVLDKNYKKEDVVSKKEIRVASSYSRSNVSVDDVRNKALGVEEESVRNTTHITDIQDEPKKTLPTTFEVDEDEENLLVDLTDDREKPEVKELTMGDALEYFQDLGLEYNVDYVDASKNNTTKVQSMKPKSEKENKDANILSVLDKEVIKDEPVNNDDKIKTVIKNESPIGAVNNDEEDDDNLFDLIDSMYEEKGV